MRAVADGHVDKTGEFFGGQLAQQPLQVDGRLAVYLEPVLRLPRHAQHALTGQSMRGFGHVLLGQAIKQCEQGRRGSSGSAVGAWLEHAQQVGNRNAGGHTAGMETVLVVGGGALGVGIGPGIERPDPLFADVVGQGFFVHRRIQQTQPQYLAARELLCTVQPPKASERLSHAAPIEPMGAGDANEFVEPGGKVMHAQRASARRP